MTVIRSRSFLFFVLGLAACGGPAPQLDAGPPDSGRSDAGPPDAGPPLACDALARLDAVLGDTVTVSLDTRESETRPRDLGLSCGNPEAELRWARQEVVELHIPGTGPVSVELDTVFPGDTDAGFNTVLQIRESCGRVPVGNFPPSCFDDVSATEFRSQGALSANGGDVLYVIVTGFSNPPATQGTVDEGRVRLDVTVRANAPPTVTAGSLVLALDDVFISASGNDADADVRGVAMNFLGPTGELLDIYGDGQATEDVDVFVVRFDPVPATAAYAGQAVVRSADVNLGAYLRSVGATQARLRVFDEAYATSDPLDVDVVEAELVGAGETCDSTHVCRPEMSCEAGVCGANGAVAAACGGATDLAVPADGTPITRPGTTGAGLGNFRPSSTCVPNPDGVVGAETIYSVTIPDGTIADLILTTELPGTGATDTIVYVRSACPDSGTELGCNDDRASGDLQSDVEVRDLAAGTYFVFLECYGGLASGTAPHALRTTLRPVLPSGAACDAAGALNRCATGVCTAGACP